MKILLVTPPLTQLNTPYPATAYLKGFLVSGGHEVQQADLGIELINIIFSSQGLNTIFERITINSNTPGWVKSMYQNRQLYCDAVDAVMRFLQGKEPTLAIRICNSDWLPRGRRFDNMADADWAFGTLGNTEMARHIATLFIEDLADLIKSTIEPDFELSRYGEKLCLRLPTLDPLLKALQRRNSLFEEWLISLLKVKLDAFPAQMVCFSIPFPGNLLGAFQCSRFIRSNYPDIKVVWGGGYVNTELRSLNDGRVFDYAHFIALDDGEPALDALIAHISGVKKTSLYKTYFRDDAGEVVFVEGEKTHSFDFKDSPAPDYSDLPHQKYISMIEMANPMHKLWSDGRWNKLVLAHGCYWAKCAFCDTGLPYISEYCALPAERICEHIATVMKQTGSSGFHFTDEAAPPKLLRELSNEIIKRKIVISWWTNVRFEKAFTPELCQLMARAGCIAVSGGIEVASDRLLKLINKGVTVSQAFETAGNFSSAGIMVHAYLMYGFPSQTQKETLEGLDTVRRMFSKGIIQSAFWHRYAMTIHSPSGKEPHKYGATKLEHEHGSFANNEIAFTDNLDVNHDYLGGVLRKATYNYMHGIGLDWPVKKWL